MIKKLLKYGKIVVALTLIGALTLPSYATVGASDGSAFVTKAEFDSALSDFNARLTTFEAGINSKIDSQVSSYLDRNGIWNGRVQELCTISGSTKTVLDYPINVSTYTGVISMDMNNFNSKKTSVCWDCNKSGLCRMQVYQSSYTSAILNSYSDGTPPNFDLEYHSMVYGFLCWSESSSTVAFGDFYNSPVIFELKIPGNEFLIHTGKQYVGAFAGAWETFAFVQKNVRYYLNACLTCWSSPNRFEYNFSNLYIRNLTVY